MKIPNYLWQTWKHAHPPSPLKRLIASFRKLNPAWDYKLFTDADIADFIATEFPHLAGVIARYPGGVYLADIWRCLILYRYGGVYSDIDVECIRPLDELLAAAEAANIATPETEILVTREHPVHESQYYRGRVVYMNFFMMAQPGSRFLGRYLERLEKMAADHPDGFPMDPVALTGPGAFSDIVEEAGGPANLGLGLLPWEWASPLPDMAIPGDFPGKRQYDELIRKGDWAQELNPFVAHYWWHNYCGEFSTISKYGPALFQTDGMIASRRLENLVSEENPATYVAGRALAEFAELEHRVLVDLSAARTGSELSRLAAAVLAQLDYHSLPALPNDGTGIGLLHVESGREESLSLLADIWSRGLMAPGGLLYVSGNGNGFGDEIRQRALAHSFEILEDEDGLLLRAPDPKSQILSPKIIHQTWKTNDIPDTFQREWIDSWLEHNGPNGWEYRFWTDDDLMALVADEFPDFADCFCDYDHHIKRVDAARYLILKRHGGLYVDLDFACLKPFDELLAGKRLLFGTEFDHPTHHEDSVCNALMASVPGHPFWDSIEHDLRSRARHEVLPATGPHFLGRRLRDSARFLKEKDLPQIARRDLFYPFRWNNTVRDQARATSLRELAERYPDSYAITFWTGTWF